LGGDALSDAELLALNCRQELAVKMYLIELFFNMDLIN